MPENNSLQRLQELLRDLFQYDYADLDFGIYRLLRLKRGEVEAFLTEQLPRRVDEVFKSAAGNVLAQMERELAGLAERVRQEIDAEALAPTGEIKPEYREQRAKAARELIAAYEAKREQVMGIQVSEEQKAEVFNHLWAFFSRYYEAGDFIPKRRYGARETYAVPYNGEEVFFHWANRGQHYVKTTEALHDYAFTVDMLGRPCRVRFTLAEASLPPGNTKGDTRYFFPLPKEAGWDKDTRTFTLPFHYRLPTETEIEKRGKNTKLQEAVLQTAMPKVIEAVPDAGLKARLAEIVDQKENEEISLLLKRLRHFCRKNTSDFFIHKNLDSFLRRELEFYLKDQVLHLADLDGDLPARQRTLHVIHQLAEEVIQFLAQIENVQKRFFEKRKFVLKTDYLVPVQNVPHELWKEVTGNAEQLAAWKELFAVEPKKVNEKFLADHPTLVVNTAHFDVAFKERLLAGFDDLDEATDGLLIHSENYQALRFLESRYSSGVKCIYIDPPYNTSASTILYKNNYRHSTWTEMMHERLAVLRKLMPSAGAIFVSIDNTERTMLEAAMDDVFGVDNRIEELIWVMNTNNAQAPNYSTNHEYVEVYAKERRVAEQDREMFREPKPGYAEVMELVEKLNPSYLRIQQIEAELCTLYERHKMEYREAVEAQGLEWEDEKGNDPWKGLYNYCHAEYRDADGKYVPESAAKSKGAKIWIWREGDISMPATKQSDTTRKPKHINYRYYRPKHPVTGKPVPIPRRGWNCPYEGDSPGARSFVSLDKDHRIIWGEDETKVPQLKRILQEAESNVAKSVFVDYSDGEKQTFALFGKPGLFLAPKHTDFVSRFIQHGAKPDSVVLDCFGGSGSTPHAAINLNREDEGRRKFVCVEMGGHFDTLILPRIQKVMFTPQWKNGEPVRDATRKESARTPRLVKVLRLEGYEDALHNLVSDETLERETPRAKAFKEKVGGDAYRLTYMARLPLEASASMLNLAKLEHPFAYTIEVLGEDGPRMETVDLLETFNFLYGLHVQRIETWRDNAAKRDYRVVKAKKADGRHVLVLWRDMDKLDPAVERRFLEVRLKQNGPFDEAWINGDSAVPGVQSLDGVFKRLLEEEER